MARVAVAAAVVHLLVALAGSINAVPTGTAGTNITSNSTGRSLHSGRTFLQSLEFKHKLRICNAYPSLEAVDVFQSHIKLTATPIRYKTCLEITSLVRAGDKLQFRIGGVGAGSFAVSELPSNDAVLVLVIYRRDARSAAVAFESHVFGNLINAQIAVLDTYRGTKKAGLHVQDTHGAKTARSEELRFDSVVAVNPGVYEVVLEGEDGATKATQELVALNRENYVVVRCGVEEEDGQGYPQELMVFPNSDSKVLMGAAPRRGSRGAAFAALAALLLGLRAGAPERGS